MHGNNNNSCADRVEACGDDAELGYTEDHVPVVSTPLDEQYDTEFIDGDDVEIIDSDFTVNCTLYLGAWCDRIDLFFCDKEVFCCVSLARFCCALDRGTCTCT